MSFVLFGFEQTGRVNQSLMWKIKLILLLFSNINNWLLSVQGTGYFVSKRKTSFLIRYPYIHNIP